MKSNVADVEFVGLFGCAVIVTVGLSVSTDQVKLAGFDVPALGSTASTSKVCEPSGKAEYDCGLGHEANAAPSNEHWNVADESESVKLNDADVWFVGLPGPDVIIGAGGGGTPTRQANVAEPTLPAGSVPVTVNVWLPSANPE